MNNIKKYYLLFASVVFIGSVYVSATSDFSIKTPMVVELPEENIIQKPVENKINIAEKEVHGNDQIEEDIPQDSYYGRWKRIEMTINGVPIPIIESSLVLKEGYFEKVTDCKVSGNLIVEGDKMVMRAEEDGCNQGDSMNFYELSEDKNTLSLVIKDDTYTIKDIYKRIINK